MSFKYPPEKVAKVCTRCQVEKSVDDFYRNRQQRDGHSSWCAECEKAYQRDRSQIASIREARKPVSRRQRLKRYGLTPDAYEMLLLKQDSICAICMDERAETLAVDHNHITGENRGLLCGRCNKAIGLLEDDASYVYRAFRYLLQDQSNGEIPYG